MATPYRFNRKQLKPGDWELVLQRRFASKIPTNRLTEPGSSSYSAEVPQSQSSPEGFRSAAIPRAPHEICSLAGSTTPRSAPASKALPVARADGLLRPVS